MAVLKGGLLLFKENAIGSIDGSNTTFTTSFSFVPGTLTVFLNGVEQGISVDYVEIDLHTFEFVTPPIGGVESDVVRVQYQKA